MKHDEDCHNLPGWNAIVPPPGGLARLRHAMQQAMPPEPSMVAMGLGGAMSAVALVATLWLVAGVRQQSDSVQRIVSQAQAYQEASTTFAPMAGEENAPVRVYVAMPIASVASR